MISYSQVERKGNSAINEIHNLDLVQQFEGSENRLHKYGYYSFSINCNQDFSSYPFDRQVCELEICIDALAGAFVTLTPQSELVEHTQKTFGSFAITNITLKGSGGMLTLAISYQRDLMGIFMTTYLPTIFLNMLSQCTHYYGDTSDIFDPIIGTNLTILMVLTALHISVYTSLPSTGANMKNIDVWLIFNLMFTLLTTLLQIFIQNQRCQLEQNISQVKRVQVDRIARRGPFWQMTTEAKMNCARFIGKYINAAAGVIFVAGYWLYGIIFLRA